MTKLYDALPWILRVILQIFFGYFISFFYRLFCILEGKGLNVLKILIWILILVFFSFILWWVDLFTVIFEKKIKFFTKF